MAKSVCDCISIFSSSAPPIWSFFPPFPLGKKSKYNQRQTSLSPAARKMRKKKKKMKKCWRYQGKGRKIFNIAGAEEEQIKIQSQTDFDIHSSPENLQSTTPKHEFLRILKNLSDDPRYKILPPRSKYQPHGRRVGVWRIWGERNKNPLERVVAVWSQRALFPFFHNFPDRRGLVTSSDTLLSRPGRQPKQEKN